MLPGLAPVLPLASSLPGPVPVMSQLEERIAIRPPRLLTWMAPRASTEA